MKDLAMRLRPALFAGLGAATLLLAACHRSEPPPPLAENDAMTTPEPPLPLEPAPVPQVVEVPTSEAPPKPKPAPEVSADQQVIDDADATGMTAHANHDGDDGGDSQPASGGGNGKD